MKTLLAPLAFLMLVGTAHASDVKVYPKAPETKVKMAAHIQKASGLSHSMRDSGRTKAVAKHKHGTSRVGSTGPMNPNPTALAGDKHKTKKSLKHGRTKF